MRIFLISLFTLTILTGQTATNSWEDYLRLAKYYEKSNETEKAALNFEKAWKISNGKLQVYDPYFSFASRSALWKKGLEISMLMYNRFPGQIKYIRDYSQALIMSGKKHEGISFLNKQLQKKEFPYVWLTTLSNVLMQCGLYNEGVEFLENGYQKFPRQSSLLMQIASLYQIRLSYVKATEYFLKYLDQNHSGFIIVQNRILNMLDNWDDARDVVQYIQSHSQDNNGKEIISSIYLKFNKYDLALPLLKTLYQSQVISQYGRYLQYAREARRKGNAEFALNLLDFLSQNTNNANHKTDIMLTRYEILFEMMSGKSPLDSVRNFNDKLLAIYPTLQNEPKKRVLKLLVRSDHYLLNDLDKGIEYARQGLKIANDPQSRDFFTLEMVRMSFEKGDFKIVGTLKNNIRLPQNMGEALFLGLLATFHNDGIAELTKSLNRFFRKLTPNDDFFNDALQLKTVIMRSDSVDKVALLNGYTYLKQKKYAQAEKEFFHTIDKKNTNPVIKYLCNDKLFFLHEYTGSSLFLDSAKKLVNSDPGNPQNARIYWQLSLADPMHKQEYYDKIINDFPDSFEAGKIRDLIRNNVEKIG